ncbi:MAG: hypothetical protein IH606_23450 [Burkholderiales bacterium]|nr:hypothetical protein [Burkholderiales bacterium]
MSARKRTKQPAGAPATSERRWPAAWGEPSKEEVPVPAPKWKIWIATRRVTLENAILLSLGYCPNFFKGESIAHLLNNDPAENTFYERLHMLKDCHVEPNILLSDFASRAVSEFKWKGLPHKLKALAASGPEKGAPVDNDALSWSTASTPPPATQDEIEAAFPIAKWGDKLRKAPSGKYKWLAETWIRKGTPRPGDATTYNPVLVAIALVNHHDLSIAACDSVIKRHFSAWRDEWERKSEYLKN